MSRQDREPRRRLPNAERRTEILDAAEAAFMVAPYDQVSLVSIARAAAASDALVLRHFETKANLYLSVWERRLDEFFTVQAAADDARRGLSAGDRLTAGLRDYLDFVAVRPRAWAQQFLAPDGEPVGAAEFRRGWRERHVELIRERGELPDDPLVHTVLSGFVALNEALCFEWVLQDCPDDQRDTIVSLSAAALSALLTQAKQLGLPRSDRLIGDFDSDS